MTSGSPSDESAQQWLEPGQRVEDLARPLPRAVLSRRVRALLWGVRLLLLVLTVLVVVLFVQQL